MEPAVRKRDGPQSCENLAAHIRFVIHWHPHEFRFSFDDIAKRQLFPAAKHALASIFPHSPVR
jgi:hypothetical protein